MNSVLKHCPPTFQDFALNKAVIELEYPEIFRDRNIGDKFMEILVNNQITTVFQPIISLKDGLVYGYEALSRGPKDSVLENPGTMFDVARVYGKLWELEFLCRIKALENAAKCSRSFNIFINVDPNIIKDDKFKKGFTKEFLKKFDIDPENVIFEITERNSVADIVGFKKLIDNYKDQGYKIAIDDTGSGYSGLNLITDINPHFIKLDMNLIRNIDKDGVKYALVKTLYEFCQVTNIKVIAEGIETVNELNAVIDIGIDYGQGFLIQRPCEEFIPIKHEVLTHITSRNLKKSALYYCKPSTVYIGDICRDTTCIQSTAIGENVLDIFDKNPTILGVPVVDNDKLSGLIMKDKFFAKLGTQYGYALFVSRPVDLIMNKYPLCVDFETTIDIAAKLAMNRSSEYLYDYIIITKNSNYFGIVTVKDLLEKTIELEVNYAKHLNPLSGLPGNVLIEQKLKELVKKKSPYTVLYLDIDNFKVYNDVYGFEKGDWMLQFLSRIITEAVSSLGRWEHFIGHIGGDDFVIIVESFEVDQLCTLILDAFSKGISDFYSAEHIENKTIFAKNRFGLEEQYSLVTLSIAGVSNRKTIYKDIYELTEHASKIKKQCKENWDNCYITV